MGSWGECCQVVWVLRWRWRLRLLLTERVDAFSGYAEARDVTNTSPEYCKVDLSPFCSLRLQIHLRSIRSFNQPLLEVERVSWLF